MIGFYCNNPRGWIAIRACITLLLTPSTELFLGELNLLITDMSQSNCWVTVHDEQVEGDGGGGGSMTAHGRLGAAKIIWTREDWGGGLRVWSSHHCRERPGGPRFPSLLLLLLLRLGPSWVSSQLQLTRVTFPSSLLVGPTPSFSRISIAEKTIVVSNSRSRWK